MSFLSLSFPKPKTLQHPTHDHLLILSDFGGLPILERCYICGDSISICGSAAYYCHRCSFYIHKECGEAPSQILHPFHLLHPVTLSNPTSEQFTCNVCLVQHNSAYAFSCEECGFNLDVYCAVSTLPDKDLHDSGLAIHSCHDHPLIPFHARRRLDVRCRLCKMDIVREAYCCIACKFFLCKKCFDKFPEAVNHPLHTEHTLRLMYGCKADCYVCGSDKPFTAAYGCRLCSFFLDLRCFMDVNLVKHQEINEHGAIIPIVAHEHKLLTFFTDWFTRIKCNICSLNIYGGEFLSCPKCLFFFHGSCCAKSPERLRNPLHPEHYLSLYIDTRKGSRCPSCSISLEYQLVYRCECGFTVHTECALQTIFYYEEGASTEIKTSWHEHPMHLCHRRTWYNQSCNACGDSVEGLGYVCQESKCHLLLHESCSKLMTEREHPHHPKHPLVLTSELSAGMYVCDACDKRIQGFRFSCKGCNFDLDVKCASQIPTTKHVLHEHKLGYFENCPSLQCNICNNSNNSGLFRCVPCDFNLHVDCGKLPQTIKLKWHLHSLTLWDSYMEDDSGEYYCDFCEKRRNPNLGVYVCEECKLDQKLVADIECALPWINLKKTKDSALTKLDQKIANLEEKLHVPQKELKALEEVLEEAQRERTTIITEIQRLEFDK